jgi:CHAT domain-containing protein
MSSKLRQRSLLLFLLIIVGLSISLFARTNKIAPVLATVTPINQVVVGQSAFELEAEGKYYYLHHQFELAISFWQQAIEVYTQSQDSLSQVRVLSNLALAYSQLNNWEQATKKITNSLNLLNQDSQITAADQVPALAQVLNNQGMIELAEGKVEKAIATWEQAKVYYQQATDELGVIRASINQATAYMQLGLYHRALKSLAQVNDSLVQESDSAIKATGLRSYGDILRLVGQRERSQAVLTESLAVATHLNLPIEQVKTLLILGKSYKSDRISKASELYKQALKICRQQPDCLATDLSLQIYLAQLNLKSEVRSQKSETISIIAKINQEFNHLPTNRANIDQKINFAHSLIQLRHQANIKNQKIKNYPDWLEIEQFLETAIQQAQGIDYQQAQSYGLGLRGKIKEELQDWQNAEQYTQQALVLAQNLNKPEIVYLWEWQLGRIYQALENRLQAMPMPTAANATASSAIAHYSQAVKLLKSLSQDLVAIDTDVQYSFRDSVEPVYRELVSLLLTTDSGQTISQANLTEAREVIESFQLAELTNFFREACLKTQNTKIDTIDRQAAVIYPIILRDRLEVILSLPNQPLNHYQSLISQADLEKILEQFRQSIVVRSRRNFYQPAQQLYDLLIRPALQDLTSNKIKTLVFVPDGALRNIPWGALYDGQQYLIEDYSVAITPGLQLLAPRPLEQVELKTIAAGLTQPRQGFSALNYVDSELKQVTNKVNSVVLLNQNFTAKAFQQEIQFSDYPVVHIATHGQFSSSIEDTFLLAWDSRININQLDNILQTRNPNQARAIELLVLSACETATGDKRAALGLAGIAVRAGARSTLATLWSVNDRSTSELMNNFYHQLVDNQLPKAEAVRQAQLSLLHNGWYKHPFYWASYVLLGNWL